MEAEFIAEGGYYRIRYSGLRTYANIIRLIDEMEAQAAESGVYRYLFDLRESGGGLSLAEKYNLGIHLAKVFGPKYSVAVFMKREQITGFLENVSINRGAMKFLITDSEEAARKHLNPIKRVP